MSAGSSGNGVRASTPKAVIECVVCAVKASPDSNVHLHQCSACRDVHYCSREHQRKHWKEHKPNCMSLISMMKLPPTGTPCTKKQRKYLRDACKSGNRSNIRRGIQHVPLETDLEDEDGENWRALHYAAMHGQTDAVHLLLTTGANIEAKDSKGRTPLFCSCLPSGNVATTRLLLRAGADPNSNIQDANVISPLFSASRHDVIVALVEAGADLNVRDSNGFTPLKYLIAYQAHELAKFEWDQNKERLASFPERISAMQRCEEVDSSSGSSSPAADRRVLWLEAGMTRRNDLAYEVTGEGDGGSRRVDIELARIIVDYMGEDGVPWACVIELERDLKHTQSLQAAIEGTEDDGGGGGGGGGEVGGGGGK